VETDPQAASVRNSEQVIERTDVAAPAAIAVRVRARGWCLQRCVRAIRLPSPQEGGVGRRSIDPSLHAKAVQPRSFDDGLVGPRLIGNPAVSKWPETGGFASPPHDGFALVRSSPPRTPRRTRDSRTLV
jgi:hypothetical protein